MEKEEILGVKSDVYKAFYVSIYHNGIYHLWIRLGSLLQPLSLSLSALGHLGLPGTSTLYLETWSNDAYLILKPDWDLLLRQLRLRTTASVTGPGGT